MLSRPVGEGGRATLCLLSTRATENQNEAAHRRRPSGTAGGCDVEPTRTTPSLPWHSPTALPLLACRRTVSLPSPHGGGTPRLVGRDDDDAAGAHEAVEASHGERADAARLDSYHHYVHVRVAVL
jgi:hypothetical protein